MNAAPPEGLRARKKRATENAIERTAVRLALQKGHANVTVTEICDGADISRSTFFNYMPSREAAIFGRPLKMLPFEDAMEIMRASASETLLTAVFRVALASVGQATVNAEVAAGRTQLSMEQPETAASILSPFISLSTDLTGLLYLWLEEDHSRRMLPNVEPLREAILTVSLVGNGLQVLLAEISGSEDQTIAEESMHQLLAEMETLAHQMRQPRG
ncbi:TetR family transcriptional regulator [Nocardioides dubius]|uniref:HTH tetR-type domain-containing protein n=1 Tax=Nocardioides dubius TaxID=317019 RepID=A0ABP4EMK9_9ACTN